MFQSWAEEATKNIFWCRRTEENRGDSHPNWMWYTIIMVNLCCQRAYHSEFQIDWDTIGYTRIPSCHPRPVGGPYPGASTTQLNLWWSMALSENRLPWVTYGSYVILYDPMATHHVPPKNAIQWGLPISPHPVEPPGARKKWQKIPPFGCPQIGDTWKKFLFQ